MARMLQPPGRNPVCLALTAMCPGIVRADSFAVDASLLPLPKDLSTTDSTLKKFVFLPLFIFLPPLTLLCERLRPPSS